MFLNLLMLIKLLAIAFLKLFPGNFKKNQQRELENQQKKGGQFAPENRGQFPPEKGGQFGPESGGLVKPELGEQIHRNFQDVKVTANALQKKIDLVEDRFATGAIDQLLYDKVTARFGEELREIEARQQLEPAKGSARDKYLALSLKTAGNLAKSWEAGDFTFRQKLQQLLYPEGVQYTTQEEAFTAEKVHAVFSLANPKTAEPGRKTDRG